MLFFLPVFKANSSLPLQNSTQRWAPSESIPALFWLLLICVLSAHASLSALNPQDYNKSIPRWTALHFIAPCSYCVFTQIESGGWPCSKQVYQPHSSNSRCSFHLSVSSLDNSLHISNFSIIITCVTVICNQWPLAYDYLWSVISDLWHRSCSGHPEPCPPTMGSFIHEFYVCPDCTTGHHSPISVPLFRPLYSLRHNWN